jgi:hypothetical protein
MTEAQEIMEATRDTEDALYILRCRLEILHNCAGMILECMKNPDSAGDAWREFMNRHTEWNHDVGSGPELLALVLRQIDEDTKKALAKALTGTGKLRARYGARSQEDYAR